MSDDDLQETNSQINFIRKKMDDFPFPQIEHDTKNPLKGMVHDQDDINAKKDQG